MLSEIKRFFSFFLRKLFKKELLNILSYHVHPTALLYGKKNIILATSSLICEYVIFRAPVSRIIIGDKSQIGPFCVLLSGENEIIIGDNVMVAPHCVIAVGNHEYKNLKVPMIAAGSFSNGPVIIEDDVWIGANCTICDNVKIGKGAIIAANSIVNKNVESYSIVGGVPAKIISTRKKYDV